MFFVVDVVVVAVVLVLSFGRFVCRVFCVVCLSMSVGALFLFFLWLEWLFWVLLGLWACLAGVLLEIPRGFCRAGLWVLLRVGLVLVLFFVLLSFCNC